ncbi:MAG: DUF998 domain-containing protein [Planctomycetota bacterium]
MNPTRIGILIFASTALSGPWYTVKDYSSVSNLISQLGAQNTQNNYIMVAGFLALGIGIVADGIRRFRKPVLPFIAFGLFMALAGLLAHKPLSPAVEYSEGAHQAHSGLATLAGISITVGLLWQAVLAITYRSRAVIITLAVLCLALPLCMLAFQQFQGFIQRIMYLFLFAWLWINFPIEIMTKHASRRTPTGGGTELQ